PTSTPLAEATFTFVPGAGVSTECALDSEPPAPCTSPVSFESLPPGQHTFTVLATDATGTGDPSIYPWTIVPRAITISDSGFTPSSLTSVTPGSWVRWTNNGTGSHTVT